VTCGGDWQEFCYAFDNSKNHCVKEIHFTCNLAEKKRNENTALHVASYGAPASGWHYGSWPSRPRNSESDPLSNVETPVRASPCPAGTRRSSTPAMWLLMERQPPAGIMDRGRLGHATPKVILFKCRNSSAGFALPGWEAGGTYCRQARYWRYKDS
jgi:hypothetical protein